MKAWFEHYRKRFERELAALDKAEIGYQIDPVAKAQNILRLELHIDGRNPVFDLPGHQSLDLVVVYPDNYPFFRPDIYAYDLSMPRHHNPFGKNLCVLPRSTEFWSPELTVADLLQEQLIKVLEKGQVTDPEVLLQDEEEQAEPESDYYPTLAEGPVLFDDSHLDIQFNNDQVELIGLIRVGIPDNAGIPTRLVVLETSDTKGVLIGKVRDETRPLFPRTIKGVLYKLPRKPPHGNLEQDLPWLMQALKAQGDKLEFPGTSQLLKGGTELVNVIGLAFPEENSEAGRADVGWLFVIAYRYKEQVGGTKKNPRHARKNGYYYAKALRISGTDMQVRIPKLKPLRDKVVAVAGLGALGAPSAIELAKSGVGELRLLDYDFVDPGTTVRWPFGFSVAGLPKIGILKSFIEQNYPATKVVVFSRRIGSSRIEGRGWPEPIAESERELMEAFLSGISLLYDATAEIGIMNYLSFEARERKIPYVCIHAGEGAIGGLAMRVVPGQTEGCWMCLRLALKEGEIPDVPFEKSGKVQAVGCGDVTFTGAGFDLQNIAMAGVRLTAGILCEGEEGGYPSTREDVGILSLLDESGQPVFPRWSAHVLKKHPRCPYCQDES